MDIGNKMLFTVPHSVKVHGGAQECGLEFQHSLSRMACVNLSVGVGFESLKHIHKLQHMQMAEEAYKFAMFKYF